MDSLGAIVSMQPDDLLQFRYCYGSNAAMLVVILLCTCGLFQWTRPPRYPHDHSQFSSDIKHLQDQEILNGLILKLKALWFFEMLITVNSQHSKYSRWLEELQHCWKYLRLACLIFMTRTLHSLSCALDTRILYMLWHSLSNVMTAKGLYSYCIKKCHCWISNYVLQCNFN